MSSSLLHCSICPRRPAFSDTSHLLTHVGSKGHLAHLHRLQVRSHQEIEAGHLLANYNLWYQQHGLGGLLSERLPHKEARTADRQDRARVQGATRAKRQSVSAQPIPLDPALAETAPKATAKHPDGRLRRVKRQPASNTDSDYESSPVRSKGSANLRNKKTKSLGAKSCDVAYPAPTDAESPVTPEHAKLKGVVWPGMDLFDAATPEMKRRRNQKKDRSILRRMQKQSDLTEPTEIIYSPSGSLLKERFIDGNVDVSSPLKGETPVPQSSIRRRRVPLASLSANIPRPSFRRAKKTRKAAASPKRLKTPVLHQSGYHGAHSTPPSPLDSLSHFSPTEKENTEFKLTIGNLASRKQSSTFTIFNDRHEDVKQERSSTATYRTTMFSNPLAEPPAQGLSNPQLSFITAPWLQPAYQQASYYNREHEHYNHDATAPKPLPQVITGKENISWYDDAMNTAQHVQPNPLDWPQATATAHTSYLASSQYVLDSSNGSFDRFEDTFAYNRNPLNHAVSQYNVWYETGSTEFEQRTVSPDGTISDHDTREYQRAGFAA